MKSLISLCLVAIVYATGARADCYDVFGCANQGRFRLNDLLSGPNCNFLYLMRNSIYHEHGYCFHTPRGQSTFGNAGCVTGDAGALALNANERYNASIVLQAENAKGCLE